MSTVDAPDRRAARTAMAASSESSRRSAGKRSSSDGEIAAVSRARRLGPLGNVEIRERQRRERGPPRLLRIARRAPDTSVRRSASAGVSGGQRSCRRPDHSAERCRRRRPACRRARSRSAQHDVRASCVATCSWSCSATTIVPGGEPGRVGRRSLPGPRPAKRVAEEQLGTAERVGVRAEVERTDQRRDLLSGGLPVDHRRGRRPRPASEVVPSREVLLAAAHIAGGDAASDVAERLEARGVALRVEQERRLVRSDVEAPLSRMRPSSARSVITCQVTPCVCLAAKDRPARDVEAGELGQRTVVKVDGERRARGASASAGMIDRCAMLAR